jgi:hypothetical protein
MIVTGISGSRLLAPGLHLIWAGSAMTTNERYIRFFAVLFAICASPLAMRARADEPQSPSRPLQTAATGQPKASPDREAGRWTLETAGPTRGRSVGLAEFTVIRLTDREIRLRLTLRSIPPPQFVNPGAGEVSANANRSSLITIDVGALIVRRPQRSGS